VHDDIVIDYGLQPDEPQPAQQFELCAVADDESTVSHNAFYRYKSLLLIVNYTSANKDTANGLQGTVHAWIGGT